MQNQQNLQSTDSTKGCDQPDEIHQNGKIIIAKGVEPRNFMETTIKTRGRSEMHEIKKKHLASDRAAEIAEEPLVRSKHHEKTAKIVTPAEKSSSRMHGETRPYLLWCRRRPTRRRASTTSTRTRRRGARGERGARGGARRRGASWRRALSLALSPRALNRRRGAGEEEESAGCDEDGTTEA